MRHWEVLLMDKLFLLSEAQLRRIEPYFPLSHGIRGSMIKGLSRRLYMSSSMG